MPGGLGYETTLAGSTADAAALLSRADRSRRRLAPNEAVKSRTRAGLETERPNESSRIRRRSTIRPMRISKVSFSRYRSFFEDQSIEGLGSVAAFVGANNAGKSNVFRGVSLAVGQMEIGNQSVAFPSPFLDEVSGGVIEHGTETLVSLTLNLTEEEWAAIPVPGGETPKPWMPECEVSLSLAADDEPLTPGQAVILSSSRDSARHPVNLGWYVRPRIIHVPTQRRLEAEQLGKTALIQGNIFDGRVVKNWINEFSTGRTTDAQQQYRDFLSDLHSVAGFEQLELTVAASQGNVELLAAERPGAFRVPLDQCGAGLQMVVIVLAALHQVPSRVVMVDDPEAGLHPIAQESFARIVASRVVARGSQIMFATHSPAVLEAVPDDQVIEVRRDRGLSATLRRVGPDASRLLDALRSLGYRPSMLRMAEAVLFLEGPSDEQVVRAWWHTLFEEVPEPAVAVVALGGQNYEHLKPESVKALGRQTFVMLDSDRTSSTAPPSARAEAFANRMAGFATVHILTRRSIENYFTPRALQEALNLRALPTIDDWCTLQEVGIEYSKRHHPAVVAERMSRDEIDDEIARFLTSVQGAAYRSDDNPGIRPS